MSGCCGYAGNGTPAPRRARLRDRTRPPVAGAACGRGSYAAPLPGVRRKRRAVNAALALARASVRATIRSIARCLSRISILRRELLTDDLAHPLPRHAKVLSQPRLQTPPPARPGDAAPDQDPRRDPKLLGPRQLLFPCLLLLKSPYKLCRGHPCPFLGTPVAGLRRARTSALLDEQVRRYKDALTVYLRTSHHNSQIRLIS